MNNSALRRKVAWRILPFVFLLFVVAYLDRANVGFAKLSMADALHFSDAAFGFGFGVFFVGYLLLEIPGAVLVERWSARKWFARILISWGFCSVLTAFVRTPGEFYVVRFLLGVAEAGFFPGIIVYLTHWFTAPARGRALAGFIMAVPFSLALGAPVSSVLLSVDWLGLQGWQWLFILEGVPAVVLGVITLFVFVDRPGDAKWLSKVEADSLIAELEAESRSKGKPEALFKVILRSRAVWLLALGIFLTNCGGYALAFWLPTAIQGVVGGSRSEVLWWSGLIYACGIVGVFLAGQLCDRFGYHKWHCMAGQLATALCLTLGATYGKGDWTTISLLCLAGFSGYYWSPPFWSLSTLTLTATSAAVAIGFINMTANLAGYFGNYAVGQLKTAGFDDRASLLFCAACYAAGAMVISFFPANKSPGDRTGVAG